MKRIHTLIMFFILMFPFSALAQQQFATDVIPTSAGDARITFLGHGTLMLSFAGKIIHADLLKDAKGIELRIRNLQ